MKGKNKLKIIKVKEEKNQKSDEDEQSKFNIEIQNLTKSLSKKNIEISFLKKKITEDSQYISSIQSELFTLKKFYSDSSKLKRELDISNEKNQQLEREIEDLKQKILEQHKEFSENQRIEDKKHLTEISKLRGTVDNYVQKTLRSNMNELDNVKLYLQLNELKKKNEDIVEKTKQQIIQKEIDNKIKFTKLKDRMLANINETKDEVSELNMKYMDISTKLTLLQNHQLLIQLDYQTQQLEESTKKNEIFKKKISDLTKDIELHKEVEVSLAEKNRKLIRELSKYKKEENKDSTKEGKSSEDNFAQINKSSLIGDSSFNNNQPQTLNISILTNSNSFNNKFGIVNSNDYSRILSLEKKVLNLEKKLEQKKREYNDLKEKNEHIENMLKNKDRKYSGLYNFLEESLNQFFSDENIINNKEIYINTETLKHFDFSQLSKEQKYSTLIILMKYLLPLITNEKEVLKPYSSIEKYTIRPHIPKEGALNINDKFRKFFNIKQRNKTSSVSSDNLRKVNFLNSKNVSDSLPSISLGPSYRKNKIQASASIQSGKINQSLNQQ